jgi:hypothetical protein
MNGLIDEILIHYRAPPPAEIRTLYQKGSKACAA